MKQLYRIKCAAGELDLLRAKEIPVGTFDPALGGAIAALDEASRAIVEARAAAFQLDEEPLFSGLGFEVVDAPQEEGVCLESTAAGVRLWLNDDDEKRYELSSLDATDTEGWGQTSSEWEEISGTLRECADSRFGASTKLDYPQEQDDGSNSSPPSFKA